MEYGFFDRWNGGVDSGELERTDLGVPLGHELWTHSVDGRTFPPASVDGVVFVAEQPGGEEDRDGDQANLWALDAQDGGVFWKVVQTIRDAHFPPMWAVSGRLVIERELVGADDRDACDELGSASWFDVLDTVDGSVEGEVLSSAFFHVDDEWALAAGPCDGSSSMSSVRMLSLHDLREDWSVELDWTFTYADTFAQAGGVGAVLSQVMGGVLAVDLESGEELWRVESDELSYSWWIVGHDQWFWVRGNDGRPQAFDARSGDQVCCPVGDRAAKGVQAALGYPYGVGVVDGALMVPDESGVSLYSTDTGQTVSRFDVDEELGNWTGTAPLVEQIGMVHAWSGRLIAIDKDGSVRWQAFPTTEPVGTEYQSGYGWFIRHGPTETEGVFVFDDALSDYRAIRAP